MKFAFAIAFIILLPVCNAAAQKRMNAREAVKHVNDSVEICDYVSKFRQTPDSAILVLGKGRRENKLIVILKDSAYRLLKPRSSGYPVGAVLIVKGVIRSIKGRPYMVVSDTFDEILPVD